MNLKTKVLGFVAGSALALGLASGTFAAGETSVTLVDGAPCTTGTVTGSPINFGTFTWNGSAYTGTSGNGTLTIPVSNGVHAVNQCNVSVTVNPLSNVGTETSIPGSQVTLTGAGLNYNQGNGTGVVTIPENTQVELTASLSVSGVTNVPATYTGTITVGSASAS